MSVNKVILIGHLGKTPEIMSFDSGKKKATFTIATNSHFKDAQGVRKEDTQWHNIIAWDKLAERATKHLQKGEKVMIEGRLTSRSYDDKDGVKRYITEVVANDFEFLSPKNDN